MGGLPRANHLFYVPKSYVCQSQNSQKASRCLVFSVRIKQEADAILYQISI